MVCSVVTRSSSSKEKDDDACNDNANASAWAVCQDQVWACMCRSSVVLVLVDATKDSQAVSKAQEYCKGSCEDALMHPPRTGDSDDVVLRRRRWLVRDGGLYLRLIVKRSKV